MKKSSQSKRISKRRDKEKKRPFDGDNNRYDNNGHEVRCCEGDDDFHLSIGSIKTELLKKTFTIGLIVEFREQEIFFLIAVGILHSNSNLEILLSLRPHIFGLMFD